MTTIPILVEQTLNILYGLSHFEHPLEDLINGAINDSVLTVTVDTAAMWKADDYAEFPATDEVIQFVTDASGATPIKRAQRGTTAASQADNTTMLKNPPFIRKQVKEQINAVIRNELWPHVWSWHKMSQAVSLTDFMYDLPLYVEEVVAVYQENLDGDERFRPLPPGWWEVERQINTTVATNSNLLVVHRVYDTDEVIYITAKRRPHISDLTNMSDEIADMIPFAAAARCLALRSPQVKMAAARTERDQDGALLRDYRGLMAEFVRQRDQLRRLLIDEVRPDLRWRPAQRAFRRTW